MLHCVQSIDDLFAIKKKLKATSYYYYVCDGKVHQYDIIRNKAWLKTDLSSLRDRVIHLPMAYCDYRNGRIEMYYQTTFDKFEEAYLGYSDH